MKTIVRPIFILLCVASFTAAADSNYLRVKGNYTVNLRASPNGRIVGKLSGAQTVEVYPAASRGGWVAIRYNGKKAYVFNSLVMPVSSGPDKVQPSFGTAMIDAHKGANLRSGPGLNTRILGAIPDDTEIHVTGSPRGDWVPVNWHGKSGYVHKSLLSGDALTEASGECETCTTHAQASSSDQDDAADILNAAKAADSSPILDKWALAAWKSATRGRKMANFLGGKWRSGNRSKGLCAAGVKEAAVAAGVCSHYPAGGAYAMYTSGSLAKNCPRLKKSSIKDPRKAPPGSLIVYSGYAGHIPHHFGHTETKITVTPALYAKIKHDSKLSKVKIGQSIYCSDYCRAAPTMTKHNPVAAIYVLR